MIAKSFSYDFCAFIILSFLLIAAFFRRMTRGRSNRYYILTLCCCILSCFFDIIAICIDNYADPEFYTLQVAAHTGYLFAHNMTSVFYLMFIIALTDTFHLFGQKDVELYFALSPAAGLATLLAVNVFNGMLFTVKNGIYERGDFMPALYIIAAIFGIVCFIYPILYRKLFTLPKLISLISTFPLMSIAVLVQYYHPYLRIELFAITLSLLYISTFIQRPEAMIDFNTGIYKFNAYAHDMKRSFSNNKPVDVILINIANYLQIQEILSYDATNDMLKLVANRITTIVNQSRTHADIYYLDKGRFRVVMMNYGNHEKTEYTAETINAALKPKLPLNGMDITLISYVCIARCPADIDDFNMLIEFGKDLSGKTGFTGSVLHAGEILDKNKYNLMGELDKIITDAIRENRFEVYYQPIYSLRDKKYLSAEALLRLYNEKYGFIPPDVFIPKAEQTGDILKIGRFVFEEVCKFIGSSEFKELGLEYIEVNLSVIQCMQGGLAGDFITIMKKYNVSPSSINLEITETADSHTQNIIAENMKTLLDAGFTFSLDDFGTGYSNMQRMASLPLKIVKLDKTFADFESNPRLLIVLQNIVKMLKDMNMEIVVEGVETKELVERFSMLECEFIQGFYYSRPLQKKDFIEFIRSHANDTPEDIISSIQK